MKLRTMRTGHMLPRGAGAVIALATVFAGCGERDEIGARDVQVLTDAAQPASPAAEVARQHRAFLRALTDTAADPTPFMSTTFRLIDNRNPEHAFRRGPIGQSLMGQDRLRTLTTRVEPIYARADALDVHMRRTDYAVVITKHGDGPSSVTHWMLVGETWRVMLFNVHADDATLRRVRAEFAVGS